MENKKDYIVRGTAANGQIRCFAITSRNLVEEARSRHKTSPVITTALGRLLSGGAMMGAMMKGVRIWKKRDLSPTFPPIYRSHLSQSELF